MSGDVRITYNYEKLYISLIDKKLYFVFYHRKQQKISAKKIIMREYKRRENGKV